MAVIGPWIEAFAPPTMSNIGPGFDCVGIAVAGPGDNVRARKVEQPGVHLTAIHGDGGKLPLEPALNTASVAVAAMLRRHAPSVGIELVVHKGLPLGSGLGSSGASACAALVATDEVLGLELGPESLVSFARAGEFVACGAAHPDNVAPGIVGGIVLISALDPLRIVSLPVPEDLWFALYTPGCEVSTKAARQVLPARVSLAQTVRHASRLGLLVHALHRGELPLLGEAIVDDIVEPARAPLIPGYPEAKAACLEAGAIACSISGAGPTTFAIAGSEERAGVLLELLEEAFTLAGVPGEGRVTHVCGGARIVSPRLH
jgi:homoserine kinase